MIDKPIHKTPCLDDVQCLPNHGPWITKSSGHLNVLFGINFIDLSKKFFHYEKSELDKIPNDIRGLRSYRVSDLQDGALGANEWHMIRNELVFVARGSVKWTCEDVYGNSKEFILDQKMGVWVPPFILHTYEALIDDTDIYVVANTLYLPDDPTTHDTYSATDFNKLQKLYQTR